MIIELFSSLRLENNSIIILNYCGIMGVVDYHSHYSTAMAQGLLPSTVCVLSGLH